MTTYLRHHGRRTKKHQAVAGASDVVGTPTTSTMQRPHPLDHATWHARLAGHSDAG